MSTGVVINNICHSCFNVALLLTIIFVTCRNIMEYKNFKKPLLFTCGLLLNTVAFGCLFVLFWKSFSPLINIHADFSSPLFFGCNMVFLQHFFLILVVFIRIYYIFQATDLEISTRTITLFIATFIFSTIIFLLLLTVKFEIPGTDSWVTCALTLCILNVTFMVAITSLFLSKLSIILLADKRDEAFINLITKTALLSFITMLITFISCILLLFRFSVFGDNITVELISDWLISIDIYSNFLCYSLSFKYYHKYYDIFCSCCDRKCKQLWYCMLFGAKGNQMTAIAQHIIAKHIMIRTTSDITITAHETAASKQFAADTIKP